MPNELQPIQQAITSGDKRRARQLLKPLLDTNPSADLWFLASTACENPEQEIGCLRKALKLDSRYTPAHQRYTELKKTGEAQHSTLEMPPLDTLIADVDLPQPDLGDLVPRKPAAPDVFALKREKKKQARRSWNRLGCIGSVIMSLSLSYFVLTVTGSPIAAQIRQILGGPAPSGPTNGVPIFGKPAPGGNGPSGSAFGGSEGLGAAGSGTAEGGSDGTEGGTTGGQPGTPSNGLPIDPSTLATQIASQDIPALLTAYPNYVPPDGSYAAQAAQAGFVVSPNKSAALQQGTPISDVLDAGFAHEYTFNVPSSGEFAVAVQFFSPTAKKVGGNVAVLDPDGFNAENHCQRDAILVDGSSVAFTCQIHKGGAWKIQLFGRDGESTGVYIVTYDVLK